MSTQNSPQDIPSTVRSIKLLPLSMIAGLGMMSAALLVMRRDALPNDDFGDWIVIGIALLAAVSAVGGSWLFRKKIADSMGKSLTEKLATYRSATIFRFALLEGSGLVAAVLFFVSGNYLFMVIAGAMFIFMLLNRPTEDMIAEQLMLNDADRRILKGNQ